MHLMSFKMNLTILCLSILFLIANLERPSLAENARRETIQIGNYTIELSTRFVSGLKEPISSAKVVCGSFGGILDKKISSEFGMSIEDTKLEALLAACGVDFNIGIGQAKLTAKIELRNEIIKKTTRYTFKKLLLEFTKKIPIEGLLCYNQQAMVIFDIEKYFAKTKREISGWFDDEFKFEWQEKTNQRILIIAKYDETCDRRCQIQGKKKPLLDENGEQIYVCIPYQKKWEYIIPLYWDENGEILDPFQLLPEKVRNEVTEEYITFK